eukprot:scaffold9555_cov142-Skeletonema_dohrnii-CCMP3373.AAC.1
MCDVFRHSSKYIERGYCIEYAAYKMFNIIHPLLHSSNMHNAQCTSCNAQLEAIVNRYQHFYASKA